MTAELDISEYGDRAWLLRGERDRLQAIGEHVDGLGRPDFIEWVLGEQSLLLDWSERPCWADMQALIALAGDDLTTQPTGRLVEVPVRYDGPDLEEFAARTCGEDIESLIEQHARPIYQVAFMGFAPGFPYLTGLPEGLQLPRKSSPRARMAPGAVAVAAHYASIYPTASPGGWWWLGNTDVPLFDPQKDGVQAFLLKPCDQVRFVRKD